MLLSILVLNHQIKNTAKDSNSSLYEDSYWHITVSNLSKILFGESCRFPTNQSKVKPVSLVNLKSVKQQ